jgi:TonB-dependent receptor
MKTRALFASFALCFAALPMRCAHAAGAGAEVAAGTLTGRVLDADGQTFLRNARIVVEGTNVEVLTNEQGEFLLPGLPGGAHQLRASYTGFQPTTVAVNVPAAGPVEIVMRDSAGASAARGSVVQLSAFNVTTSREMRAAEMAINEKRIAPNIRDVIATDAFGTLAQDNIGDFLQNLPGVEVDTDGSAPLTVGLRGMPPEYTNIEMDGAGVSVPQVNASSRVTALRGLTMSNVDRIEVTKGPAADIGADSIGGRINMIPRSAFERSRPELRYRTFLTLNSEFLSLRKTPGGKEGGDGKSYKWAPNFELTYVNPVNKRFGLAVNASRNDYFNSFRLLQRTYSTVNSSSAAPYLTTIAGQAGHHFSRRSALGAKFDFRLSPRDVVSVAYNFNRYWVDFGNNQMNYGTGTLLAPTASGRNATTGDFGPDFTAGRPGQGTVNQIVTQNAYQTTQTHQGQATYRHRGPQWDIDATVAKSKTVVTYRLDSYGQVGQARLGLTGVNVRFDDIDPAGAPGRITVTNAAGATIDTTQLANLGTFTTPAYSLRDIKNDFSNARVDATRKFRPADFTFSVKTGALFKGVAKDRAQPQITRTYRGPAFNTLPPGTLTDPVFNLEGPNGMFKTQQWLSVKKVFDLYKANPSYYSTNEAADYISWATSLEEASEDIYAGYIMDDASFWKNRLRLTGGLRYERTEVIARGTLTNLQLQYRRDSAGNILDGNPTQAGVQPIPLTTDPLEVARLTRLPLANVVRPTYDDVYPSVNATLTLREDLLLRLGYAHTIGRPVLGQLIPSTTAAEVLSPAEDASGADLGTITTSNPNLKPWSGRNYDAALEYYTKTGGLFSVSVYRRDITDFIETKDTIATAADLAALGLSDLYEGFLLRRPQNAGGDVRQTGLELSGRQRLRPWLSLFANYSRYRTQGSEADSFSNGQTRRFNAGLQFAWKAFSMSTNFNWTGQRRGNTSGIAPNAFVYQRPRQVLNVSAEYVLRRHVSVYAMVNNLLNTPVASEAYGAETPAYARLTSERKDGSQIQFGLKGTF